MHNIIITKQIKSHQKKDVFRTEEHSEFFVGEVIQAAADNGLMIESVIFSDGACVDIGTPDDLVKAVGKNILG
jgi:hypothetical protein